MLEHNNQFIQDRFNELLQGFVQNCYLSGLWIRRQNDDYCRAVDNGLAIIACVMAVKNHSERDPYDIEVLLDIITTSAPIITTVERESYTGSHEQVTTPFAWQESWVILACLSLYSCQLLPDDFRATALKAARDRSVSMLTVLNKDGVLRQSPASDIIYVNDNALTFAAITILRKYAHDAELNSLAEGFIQNYSKFIKERSRNFTSVVYETAKNDQESLAATTESMLSMLLPYLPPFDA